jgi:cell wall-associated NlpC family hydrolase
MLLACRTARRRIAQTTAIAVTALCCAVPTASAPAGASPEDDLAAERARATALEARIDAGNREIARLDEELNLAQVAADDTTRRIAEARRQLDDAKRRAAATHDRLRQRAANLYMRAGSTGFLPALDVQSVGELNSRAKYGSVAAARDTQLLDDARVAQAELTREQEALEANRAAAEAQAETLQAARRDVERAVAAQQGLLASVQGDIATLVHEIAEHKRQAEEARARAALQAQAMARARSTQPAVTIGTPAAVRGPSGIAPENLPAPKGAAAAAVAAAVAQLGKPYVYAGAGPDAFDCSGLTMYAWEQAGVSMAHSATLQYTSFPHVPIDQLQPGDLVVFGRPIHHVGIYVGNGTMIEAPHTGAFVRYASIYRRDYAGASRP